MKIVSSFNGTGAAVYLCFGFVPDLVDVYAVEDAEAAHVHWNRGMRAAEMVEGFLSHGGEAEVLYTAGTGVQPYYGGETLTAALQTSVVYGEGIYLRPEPRKDRRFPGVDADGTTIDKWTLGHAGNRTGNLNAALKTSGIRVGEGSVIQVDGEQAVVEAITNNGDGANEVILSRALATGDIQFLGSMYGFEAVPIGDVTPAGILLSATADINVNDQVQAIVAEVL